MNNREIFGSLIESQLNEFLYVFIAWVVLISLGARIIYKFLRNKH